MFRAIKSLSAALITSGSNILRPQVVNLTSSISSSSSSLFLTQSLQIPSMSDKAFKSQRTPSIVTRLPQSSTTIGSNITHPKLPLKKGGTYSSGIFNRMFSKSSLPLTHSRAHLTMQQERLQKLEIQTEIATLPKGSIVIGLNVNYPKDYSLGTVPCYKQVALKRLSQGEKNEWEELSKKYHAQVGHYSLICEITCVTLFSENGEKVYLIDPRVLDPVSYTPLEKLLASFE